MNDKQPNPTIYCEKIDYNLPIIGLHDAPDAKHFEPVVTPAAGDCLFKFYQNWLNGETLLLTRENYGCGGAGRYMCGLENPDMEAFLKFLVDGEGLKASRELMLKWIEYKKPVPPKYGSIFVGPLKEDMWHYCKTVTFMITPDQLGSMVYGTQYYSSPEDPTPMIAPFGSGCSQLNPFDDLNIAQAAVGSTDIAMRQHIPKDIIFVSMTKSMFKQLCSLDENSFLFKPFLKKLKDARKKE